MSFTGQASCISSPFATLILALSKLTRLLLIHFFANFMERAILLIDCCAVPFTVKINIVLDIPYEEVFWSQNC
jgi:hypothetical protein